MKKLIVLALVFAVSLTAAAAMAQQSDFGTLNVTASVIGTCRVITPPADVAFGAYDPTDPVDNTNGQGSFTFRCTRGTDYGTFIVRNNQMTGPGGEILNYELYTEAGRTSGTEFPVDDTVGTPDNAADNTPITIQVYGTIPAQQNVSVGDFSENVTFTVLW
ncbi:MAG: hypothetical protein AMJ61_12995 [Desulfobacterales bacterium SG8_35_2]|jgi:spore coat protein U-like protein|nr:MAG: hypothetical protein AMJ61_12995 [Desulfobacterales bacterium SG8_35_2]